MELKAEQDKACEDTLNGGLQASRTNFQNRTAASASVKKGKRCYKCGSVYISLRKFYRHRLVCHGKQAGFLSICRYCGQEFQFLSLYNKHQLTCLILHKKKKSRKWQLREMAIAKGWDKRERKQSDKSDNDQGSVSDSSGEKKVSGYSITCSKCNQSFYSMENYELHLKKKGLCCPNPYVCKICKQEFMTAHHLLKHKNCRELCSPDHIPFVEAKEKGKYLTSFKLGQNIDIVSEESMDEEAANPHSTASSSSLAMYNANINKLEKVRYECKCCENVYIVPQLLEKHLQRNPKCARIHHYKKKIQHQLEKESGESQTARKSFSSTARKSVTARKSFPNVSARKSFLARNTDDDFVRFNYQKQRQYLWEQRKAIDRLLDERYNYTGGSARKSFQGSHQSFKVEEIDYTQVCDICQEQFATVNELRLHRKQHIHKKFKMEEIEYTHVCDVCQEQFTTVGELRLHRKRHSHQNFKVEEIDNSLVCDICKDRFLTIGELRLHRKQHSHQKNTKCISKCPECLEVFYDTFHFFDHQKKLNHWGKATKSAASTCKCPFCEKEFVHVRSRNAHLRNHADRTREEIQQFLKKTTCEVCLQIFVTESVKIQHAKIEHPEQTITLSKQFPNTGSVKKEIYDAESKSDDKKEIFRTHKYVGYSNRLKIMVKVTPSMKEQLRKHPTVCPVCFKQYSSQFVRNRHFRMHTLETAFECRFCPTRFPRSDRLTHHMQVEHNDYLGFECGCCGLRYLTRFRTVQHCAKMHPELHAKLIIKERNISPHLMKQILSKNTKTMGKIGSMAYSNEIVIPNEEFFCDVCEITFLKLCGLQRHRQSKLHRENLARNEAATVVPQVLAPTPAPLPVSTSTAPLPVSTTSVNYSKILHCSVCNQTFSSVNDFVPHRLSHFSFQNCNTEVSDLKPYICEICSKMLDNHQRVQLHLFWHLQDMQSQVGAVKNNSPKNSATGSNIVIPDNFCGQQVAKKTFNRSEKQFEQELVIGGIKKPLFTCDACNIGFTTKLHYSVHVRRYCRVRKLTSAGEADTNSEKLSPSENWHLPPSENKFLCHHCAQEFQSVDDLGVHEKTCTIDNLEKSDICRKCKCIFVNSKSFKEHRAMFCDANSYESIEGDVENKNVDVLISAMELESTVAGCTRCNLTFSSLENLSEHVLLHQNKSNSSVEITVTLNSNLTTNAEMPSLKAESHSEAHILKEDFIDENQWNFDENIQLEPSTSPESEMKAISLENPVFENNVDTSKDSTKNQLGESELNECIEISDDGNTDDLDQCTTSKEDVTSEDSTPIEPIDSLRLNFSRLLCVLISDPELMQRLGYGEKSIDDVLLNVLEQMGQSPIQDDNCTELERLRRNIRLLLDVCIKDQVMELIADGETTTDSVVIEALKIFGADP